MLEIAARGRVWPAQSLPDFSGLPIMPDAGPARAAVTASPFRIIWTAGLLAGVLDLGLALLMQFVATGGVDLVRVLQSVASGVMGPPARAGGGGAAALGLMLHLLIATIWSALFFGVAARLTWLRAALHSPGSRIAVGLGYGVVVWAGMRYVVVPLSRAGGGRGWGLTTVLMVVGHALLVGLPIAWVVWRGSAPRK